MGFDKRDEVNGYEAAESGDACAFGGVDGAGGADASGAEECPADPWAAFEAMAAETTPAGVCCKDGVCMMVGTDFGAQLRFYAGEENVFENVPLGEYTTFKIGGPAEWLVVPERVSDVEYIQQCCADHGVDLRVLGLGSDLLVSDEGVRGVVLRIAENLSAIRVEGTKMIVEAGASNAEVAEAACAAGLSGYEFACGIPGTIGGAAIMNAGAYDGEFKDMAVALTCLTPEGAVVEVSAQEADWSYRHSMMDDAGYIVLEAVLQLREGDSAEIRARMDDLQARRAEKQPLEMPSAGSTFKRPEGYFAGKLIQDAGLMGHSVGGAQVSTKHAGFVVNAGGATAADVRELISQVQERVLAESGVRLEPEVRMWGF